jgi:hypothetical protein
VLVGKARLLRRGGPVARDDRLDSLGDGAFRAMNDRGVPLARVLERIAAAHKAGFGRSSSSPALAVDALRMLRDVLTVCHSAATGIYDLPTVRCRSCQQTASPWPQHAPATGAGPLST